MHQMPNNHRGGGNGSTIGTLVGCNLRPLQSVFTCREESPVEQEAPIPMAEEVRNSYVKYATHPLEIREILTLEQFMNQKKKRGGKRFDNRGPIMPGDY